MKTLMDFNQKHHGGEIHASPYMRGWLCVILSAEAIKRAGDNLTGESIKKALESLKDFDTWGITPPFTYSNEDHRPTNRARLVMVKGGKIVQMKEVSVERDMKWIGK
jgi:branched-chain amino acid transport system substrate-binding protein